MIFFLVLAPKYRRYSSNSKIKVKRFKNQDRQNQPVELLNDFLAKIQYCSKIVKDHPFSACTNFSEKHVCVSENFAYILLTLPIPILNKDKKLSKKFFFTLLCGAPQRNVKVKI